MLAGPDSSPPKKRVGFWAGQLFRIPEFYLDPTHRPLNQGSYNKV